jgi:DNA-binding response OmpR family regulator
MREDPSVRAAPSQSGIRRRPGRILIIDDERLLGKALCACLSDENETVFEPDAAAALARLSRGERYDVVLCDVMMPGIDGMELYLRLAAANPEMARRVVFMTAGVLDERVASFLDRVSNLVLVKPFDTGALRALIERRVMGSTPASPGSAVSR